MLVYIIVATILFCFALPPRKQSRQNRIFFWLSILLILFDGLRWESGTDWDNYYQYFVNCLQGDNSHFEIGYLVFNRVIRTLTSSYTIFLLVHAFVLYLCLGLFLKKNSLAPIFSLALYFVLFVSYQGMNRQFLAVCFCLLAFNFLVEGKKSIFIILVLIGGLFHVTSFVFLLGLFFKNQYKNRTYIVIILGAIIIGNLGFVKSVIDMGVGSLGLRVSLLLDFYSLQEQISQSLLGVLFAYIRRLICLVPMLFYMNRNRLPQSILLAFNYYFIGFIVYILFNGTVLQVMVSRGNVYFMIFECILIPFMMYVYQKKIPRVALFFMIYLLSIVNMVKGIQFYDILGHNNNPFIPYKTIYYNTDVQKNTN